MTAALVAPVAVAYTDAAPCPRVGVTVTPKADTLSVTVWRTTTAGRVQVRGASRRVVSGPTVVTDYEVPFGTPATYAVVAYDAAGTASPISPSSAPVTLLVTGCPWVHDPTDPASATRWQASVWDARTFDRDSAELWPITSDVAVALTGARRQPGSTLTVLTRSTDDAARLLALTDVPVIMIRTDYRWRWRGGYFTVGDVTDRGRVTDMTVEDELWDLPLTPTGMPPPDLLSAVHDWAEVVRLYPTWAAVVAAKPSWAALVANPDPGAG
jgi:hypothetical protein